MKTAQILLCIVFFVTLWQCKKEAPPTVSITALPATVDYGTTATVTWFSTNASSCTLDGKVVATSGSVTTPLLTTKTTFNITASGRGGSANSSVAINVNPQMFTVEIISDTNGVINPSDKVISVVSGTSLPLKITSNFGYKVDSLIVNGFPVVLTGNTSTVNYTLPNIEKNSKVEVIRGKNLSWYLSQNKWKDDSLAVLEADHSWNKYLVWGVPGATQYIYTFLPDGSYILNVSGVEVGGTWTITGEETKSPVLNLKDSNNSITVWKIEQLDGVYLTISNDQIPYIGDPNFKFTTWRFSYSQLK